MTDEYEYWRLALKGEAPALSPSEADIGKPGYWKTKDGAIAITAVEVPHKGFMTNIYRNGKWREVKNTTEFPEIRGFSFALPVSYLDILHYHDLGVWPGEVAGLGHNTAGLSEFQEWKESIVNQCEDAQRWLKAKGGSVSTQVDADTAANYRDAIHKLSKQGETLLKAERQPLDEKLKEVKQRWGGAIDGAALVIKQLREVVGMFLQTEQAREEKRITDERQRLADEQKELEDQDVVLASLSGSRKAPVAHKVGAGGQLGRRTGLRTVKKAFITDYHAALQFFAEDKAVKEVVEKLCQAEARAANRREIPGVEYTEHKTAI